MRPSQVVELGFGRRAGSGYLLTAQHVLTARHVLDPERKGATGSVRALAPPDVDNLKLKRSQRPAEWLAHAAWLSRSHDLAIVKVDAVTMPNFERPRFGRVPREVVASYPCIGTGFPDAAGEYSHQIEAKLTWVLDDQRFNLDVVSASPKNWKAWAGLSGAGIFCGGIPVGVVRTVRADWNGLLTATPVQHLLEDGSFLTFWAGEGFGPPEEQLVTPLEQSVLSQVASLIYKLDRKETAAQIQAHLHTLRSPARPQAILVPGLDEDEHRHLVRQLTEDTSLQNILGRAAASDQVIVDLPWPAEVTEIDPGLWFDRVIGSLCNRVRLDPPPPGQLPDMRPLRKRLDHAGTPCAYWVLVRRAVAIAGHGELLRRLLHFWHKLPAGRPILLLLCVAWDDPVPPAKSLLPFLPRRTLRPDPELEPAIKEAVEQARLALVDDLSPITGNHLAPWIEEVRRVCRTPLSNKFDGLHALLLSRIGEGKRLRRVHADLGELLPRL